MSAPLTVRMLVVAVASVALFAGAMYLRGGRAAIERQAGLLAVLTAIAVTTVLFGPRLMELVSGSAPPPGAGARRAMRAYWVLAAVFAAVIVCGTMLLAVLDRG